MGKSMNEIIDNIEYEYSRAINTYTNTRYETPFVVATLNRLLVKVERLNFFYITKEHSKKIRKIKTKIQKSLNEILQKEEEYGK